MVGLLVDCFGFSGLFSLHWAVFHTERKQAGAKSQTIPPALIAITVGPCPIVIQISLGVS